MTTRLIGGEAQALVAFGELGQRAGGLLAPFDPVGRTFHGRCAGDGPDGLVPSEPRHGSHLHHGYCMRPWVPLDSRPARSLAPLLDAFAEVGVDLPSVLQVAAEGDSGWI